MQFCLILIILGYRIVSSDSYNSDFNVTNILYQYSLLCGPIFYNDIANIWNFANFSNAYNICPACSRTENCFRDDNCCPDLQLRFPSLGCSSQIIYSPYNLSVVDNKYKMLSSCPRGADHNTTHLCVKSRNVQGKINYPPVTSTKYWLSFHNEFCAFCNNIDRFIPWRLNINCDTKFDFLNNINELASKAIKNECPMSFYPVYTDPVKHCSDQILIDKCNVTGTWRHYDSDVEYACRTLTGPLLPYKNVFCYICNPPRVQTHYVIDSCNITRLWKTYNSAIESSCRNGGNSDTTYPYKNIYCYVCNTNEVAALKNTNSFSVHVYPNDMFTYYLYESGNVYSEKTSESSTGIVTTPKDTLQCEQRYQQWKYRIDCKFPIPFNPFDNDISSNLLLLGESNGCNVTNEIKYDICIRENRNDTGCNSLFDLKFACQSTSSQIIVQSSERSLELSYCGMHLEDIDIYLNSDLADKVKFTESDECRWFDCQQLQPVNPIQYLFCNCCIVGTESFNNTSRWGTTYSSSFNIFSWSYYTRDCAQNHVYDRVQRKCRQMDCFTGKQLIGKSCVPFLPGSMYAMPVGYTLPFIFTPQENSPSDILIYIEHVKEEIKRVTNLSAETCVISANVTNKKSFYLYIDITAQEYSTAIEYKVLQLSRKLHLTDMTNVHIEYDYKSILYSNGTIKSRSCLDISRPLVTKLLVCRHVIFKDTEYAKSNGNNDIILKRYDATLKFYQYHIDQDKKLRLCFEDFILFMNIAERPNSVYYALMTACTVLSLLCLLLTLLTYCLFPTLRTLPGKNIVNLVVSLLLYNIFYLVLMVYNASNDVLCQIIGVCLHYFLLSTFGSFTVCGIHMFKVFGTKLASSVEANNSKRLFIIYVAFVYGYSAVFVSAHIVVSYLVSDRSNIGYGSNNQCFISRLMSFIATVMVPMVIAFATNIILYSCTIHKLRQATSFNPGVAEVSKINKDQLSIFIKLFVTTGSSWILLLVNGFVEELLIYVIIAGLNSLQGLYIFIAYICNKRIYQMYKNKLLRSTTLESTSRSSALTSHSSRRSNYIGKNVSEKKL